MKKFPQRNLRGKPSATGLSTPIYHRRRRDWRDDQYLIQEVFVNVTKEKNSSKNPSSNIANFTNLVTEIENEGYQTNERAFLLAIWIREQLAFLAAQNGSYDLRVHTLNIPPEISTIISERNKKINLYESKDGTSISLDQLFPDPDIRGFALQRIQLLHKGNLLSYLHAIVTRERDSLCGESSIVMDLLHICEEKIKHRNLELVSKFNASEVDMWIPGLSLGIEVRDALSDDNLDLVICLLKNTNLSKKTRFLALVCPDDLTDLAFYKWRSLEKSNKVPNLSVLRVGDLGKYLDQISEILKLD